MVWSDLPPMNSLVPFEAAVRLGSVSAAANELHVTHGAVSRQLQILERSVGVELFVRRGRAIAATPEAVTMSRQVADALTLLASAARQVRPDPVDEALVLSCEPTLMMRWLIPRLPSLDEGDSRVNLHLSAGGGQVDMHRAGIDVAIRRNDFEIPETVQVRPLFDEWIGPVCSPETWQRLAGVDWREHVVRLTSASRPSAWGTWADLTGEAVPTGAERAFEHFYVSLEAATSGLGMAIGPYALVERDLASGRLVAPFGFVPDGSRYVLLAPRYESDRRVEALAAWLRGHAAGSEPTGPYRAV